MKVAFFSLLGVFFGVFNGVISVRFIKKNIKASNKRFYTVFASLLIYKFLFLIVSVLLMRHQKVIIILLYCLMLVLAQTGTILFSLRHYGIKRNT